MHNSVLLYMYHVWCIAIYEFIMKYYYVINQVISYWPSYRSKDLCPVAGPIQNYLIYDILLTIWASLRENLSSGVCEQHRRRLISAFVIRFLSPDPKRIGGYSDQPGVRPSVRLSVCPSVCPSVDKSLCAQ